LTWRCEHQCYGNSRFWCHSHLVGSRVALAAIFASLSAGYKFDNPTFHGRANQFGSICGLLLILLTGFLGSGGGGASFSVWTMEWSVYVVTALPCALGICFGNLASRWLKASKPKTAAIAIETCYQNTAIATSIAITKYSVTRARALAVSVPFLYGAMKAIIIGIYCLWT
jgi:predicted Na+-dependent transporter